MIIYQVRSLSYLLFINYIISVIFRISFRVKSAELRHRSAAVELFLSGQPKKFGTA